VDLPVKGALQFPVNQSWWN